MAGTAVRRLIKVMVVRTTCTHRLVELPCEAMVRSEAHDMDPCMADGQQRMASVRRTARVKPRSVRRLLSPRHRLFSSSSIVAACRTRARKGSQTTHSVTVARLSVAAPRPPTLPLLGRRIHLFSPPLSLLILARLLTTTRRARTLSFPSLCR